MTKEEALKRVEGYLTDDFPPEEFGEVEEIMKALKQDPCKDFSDINDGNIYKCSCGYSWDKRKVVRHHFCPNCGKPIDGSTKTELKPCEDCISRQTVLSKIKEVCFSEEWVQFRVDNGSNGQRDYLINYIEQLSSVTPCPNNVPDKIRTEIKGLYRVILKGTPKDDWAVRWNDCLDEVNDLLSEIQMNYCEHCGAKM